ncbi:hypothetical protein Tco_0569695 [Tanacetum coccineum]
MIPKPVDPDSEVLVAKTFHEQTNEELSEKEIKQMEFDDQVTHTMLIGLPEDIYAVVDSCDTAQEIWLRVQQLMKGSDITAQEKKTKLFNEWERFTSTNKESIESYYYCFLKLMNNFKGNKPFPEKIASNLKFNDNLQPEWTSHEEVNELKEERLAKTYDPLALMSNTQTPYNYLVFHPDQPSQITYMQQPQPSNNYVPQPTFNTNYMPQPMSNPDDISNPTTAMNMALVLMAKALKLNYSTPTNNNQRISSNLHNRLDSQNANQNGNGNVVSAHAKGNGNGNNRIHLQAEEFDLMTVSCDIDEIEEVNSNCILMANLQQASTSGTQTNKASVYDSDGSAELHHYENCYDNAIFNMFTLEEQYS